MKVKSYNAVLHMLLVCIGSYLKSVLRIKFLILDTCHPDHLYFCEQGCEDPWLFYADQRGTRTKKFWKHWSRLFLI